MPHSPQNARPMLKPLKIGPYLIDPALVLAPMAGVTDRPFRILCREMGAGMAVSEMTIADPSLWHTDKSRLRLDHRGESVPVSVQIAGYDPAMLAHAARHCVEHGAQIVDINMGCPAKKVCSRDAGSALMRDESLVAEICRAVVSAVEVPVTLKIRTGWARAHRNAVAVARLAEDAGIAALSVHGRTREDLYQGEAEYATIAAVKRAVSIPVLANGDVDSPDKALAVLRATGADGLMIGRAAQGRPWIFGEIAEFLRSGRRLPSPPADQLRAVLLRHVSQLHEFYGEGRGVRVARKHIRWYCQDHSGRERFWKRVSRLESASAQLDAIDAEFAAPEPLALAG